MSKAETQAVERLQRVILPQKGDPHDVRSLYLREAETNRERITVRSRTQAAFPAGTELSFETYFNAFPASYWRRWSQLDRVVLRVELTGEARVDVYRSKMDGVRVAVEGKFAKDQGDGTVAAEFVIPLDKFEDGGWIWFDLTCETNVELLSAGWYAPCAPGEQILPDGTTLPPQEKKVTVGIPTFNRPVDAVNALKALASDPEVDEVIDFILMPDQGSKHPADQPDYPQIAEHFGDRLREFRQGNLGGSGGYSRILYEALGGAGTPEERAKRGTGAPFILFMDDDIAIEPDSVLRAVQVARYARQPILVGGQMLDLMQRSHLHSMGETIDRSTYMWAAAPHVHYDHDLHKVPLSDLTKHRDNQGNEYSSADLHRRIDVEYNGWWMCLIPRVVAETIGQPLPLFIKWDDSEYSLRATKAGFPTATWPGVAIWHMAWVDKDDAIDWQAYFHLRNRLIVAALDHDGSARGLVKTLAKNTAKHVLCLEYSTIAIHNEAMKDFLAGPDHLFEMLESSLPRINAIRKEYPDAVVLPSATALPPASGGPAGLTTIPLSPVAKVKTLAQAIRHQLRPTNPNAGEVPAVNLPPIEARWFSMSRVDGATVTTADGRGVVFRQRNREKALELVKEAVRLQKEVYDRFDEMRKTYRDAYPMLTSREEWSKIFDAQ